ncbi:MAG: radical SAM protein [Phycisphaeraceae bacterium]|nr:radical SAM protein [Phycisphaeraceae bacterium]
MPTRTVYIETFGCQMNELDSELVTGQLRSLGYRFTPDRAQADVVLYNTCSVREHAEQKVWSRLGELRERKEADPSLVVGVLGCLAERDGETLIRRMPVVDLLCGPGELDKLPTLLDNAVRTRAALAGDEPSLDPSGRVRLRSAGELALQGNTSRRSGTLAAAQDSLELLDLSRAVAPDGAAPHTRTAYVRITRGCNKFCTYCVVPFTRGAEVHRPPDHIIEECKRLADSGVIEITLLGQTVNHYRFEHGAAVSVNGITQPQKGRSYLGGHRRDPFAGDRTTTFADLLRRIHDEVHAIQRLRFVTSYPRDFGDDVLEVIRDHPRICRYLHVPGQSGSDRILKLMNRGYSVAEYLDFLARVHSFLHQPELGRPVTIAGDIIVGFPTETDDDFAATESLLRAARYKNCFIFKYSPRPGTSAYDRLADDVPEATKRLRNNALLALQNSISAAVSAEYVGTTVPAFVTGLSPREQKKQKSAAPAPGTLQLTIGGREARQPAPAADPSSEPPQMSARTDGDLIVLFDAPRGSSPDDLIGRIIPLRIVEASTLALKGVVETR